MLRPIPSRLLKHAATLKVATGKDTWQNPAYQDYTLKKVCVQIASQTKKTVDNTLVLLQGIVFFDCRLSTPSIDFLAFKKSVDDLGLDMKVVFNSLTYTVYAIEPIYDDVGILHHYEILLT